MLACLTLHQHRTQPVWVVIVGTIGGGLRAAEVASKNASPVIEYLEAMQAQVGEGLLHLCQQGKPE